MVFEWIWQIFGEMLMCGFADVRAVLGCLQLKLKKRNKMEVIVPRHRSAVDSMISDAKLPNLYWHFLLTCSPAYFATANVTESREITKAVPAGGEEKKESCLCPKRLSLYKVMELDLLWYQIRALSIMKVKLTGNSFANETDKRANHLLSKMLPTAIQN